MNLAEWQFLFGRTLESGTKSIVNQMVETIGARE
jgi:hypothetical protein